MEILSAPFDLIVGYILPALAVLTIVVFFHELGHFQVARWCGVKVETFAIGFGKEIAGWTDKRGTRWKLCALPLGSPGRSICCQLAYFAHLSRVF